MTTPGADAFIRQLDQDPELLEQVRARILTRELLQLPETVAQLAAAQQEAAGRLDSLQTGQEQANSRLDDLTTAQQEAAGRLDSLQAGQEQANSRLDDLTTAQEEATRRLASLQAGQESLQAGQEQANSRLDDLTTAQEEATRRLASLQAGQEGGWGPKISKSKMISAAAPTTFKCICLYKKLTVSQQFGILLIFYCSGPAPAAPNRKSIKCQIAGKPSTFCIGICI